MQSSYFFSKKIPDTGSYFFRWVRPVQKLFFTLMLLGTALTGKVHAQVNNYTFGSTSGNTLETGGSFTSLLGTFLDDDVSALTNIGFTFNYGGTNYTNFTVTSNGLFQFGGSAVTDYNNVISNLTGSYLVPYWDDNYTDANGYVRYQLSGTPGSRKLIVDYFLSYLGNSGTADKRFQIWLFETSNMIKFVYGNGNNFNGDFSVAVLKNGTTDFISINTSTNTSSNSTAFNNNNTWPGAGRAYTINDLSTLPVTLTQFKASCSGGQTLLEWATAGEDNNRHFVLERSYNAQNWEPIAEIKGAGTTSDLQQYKYNDLLADGKRYYRLRQVDYNGRETISAVVSVNCIATDNPALRIYPNPVYDVMQVQGVTGKMNYSLINITGQVIKRGLLTQTLNTVDVSAVPSGLYYLQVEGNDQPIRLFIQSGK